MVDRERQIVYWVKYGRAEMYECWRRDDDWIYHVVDAALDGDPASRTGSQMADRCRASDRRFPVMTTEPGV